MLTRPAAKGIPDLDRVPSFIDTNGVATNVGSVVTSLHDWSSRLSLFMRVVDITPLMRSDTDRVEKRYIRVKDGLMMSTFRH